MKNERSTNQLRPAVLEGDFVMSTKKEHGCEPSSQAATRTVSRQAILRAAAAGLFLPFFKGSVSAQEKPPGLFTDKPSDVAPGIFVHRGIHEDTKASNLGDIANVSFVVGDQGVAVIDTGGSAIVGQRLREAIRAVTDKPVTHVINTHMHPDHVFGNAAFEPDAPQFVAHHKMQRGLAARSEFYLRAAKTNLGDVGFAGSAIVYPTMPVTETMSIDLGNRTLTLVARPTAHTDNDLTVFDETTKTLFSGDLVFSERVPSLDGSIKGWLALITAMRAEKADRVVPGHGPVSMEWPAALDALEGYWTTIATDVRAAIKDGKTISEATETAGQTEREKWLLFDDYNARNVTAAFAELEWE
jgi:quinoprotein relay system zinc metallohydrolase 2